MKTDKLIFRQLFLYLPLIFFSLPLLGSSSNYNLLNSDSPLTPQEIDSLYLLSFYLHRKNTSLAISNSHKIIQQSEKIKYKKGIANGNNLLGVIYKSVDGDYEKALMYYGKCLELRAEIGVDEDIANTYHNISKCLFEQGKIEEAISSCKKGLKQMGTDSLSSTNADLYNVLSIILTEEKQYEEAIFYLDKSYEILKRKENPLSLADYHKNKAHLYIDLHNNKSAESNYKKALEIYLAQDNKSGAFNCHNGLGIVHLNKNNFDESLSYFLKAYEYKDSINPYIKSSIEYNLGVIYSEKKNYISALDYFNSAQNIYLENKLYHRIANTFMEMASINFLLDNYKEAEKQYLKGLEYLNQYEQDLLLKSKFLHQLSELYAEEGNIQLAYTYNDKYINIKDSINLNLLKASNLQTNLEIKEKENTQLQNQILEQDQQQLWNRGLAVLSVLFGLFMSAGFVAYRNRQKRLFAEFEADQAYLQIDDILRQQELSLAYAKLETKDEMQKQIAQDLHDRLGVMLSTIKLYFGEFVEELKDLNIKSSQHQDKTIELLDEAVVEVRRIAHNMQSGVLKNFGLLNAVQDLGNTINQTGKIEVAVSNFGMKDRLSNDLEGKIFKIIQELVGNVLKHAKATKIGISMYKKDDLLNIIVEDNGIGFNVAEISEKDGMGLKNIAFRVAELEGKCHFDSNEKVGTSVIIDIPIENSAV